MKTDQLTLGEIEQENFIERLRVAFLDGKLSKLTPDQYENSIAKLSRKIKKSMDILERRLDAWNMRPELQHSVPVTFQILSSVEMQMPNGRTIAGVSWPDTRVFAILDNLVFAPEEVVRGLVIHEYLHILYPLLRHVTSPPDAIRDSIKYEYPEELWEEEECVRSFEERICGPNNNLEAWELAVEEYGDDWKHFYGRAKKRLSRYQ